MKTINYSLTYSKIKYLCIFLLVQKVIQKLCHWCHQKKNWNAEKYHIFYNIMISTKNFTLKSMLIIYSSCIFHLKMKLNSNMKTVTLTNFIYQVLRRPPILIMLKLNHMLLLLIYALDQLGTQCKPNIDLLGM